MVKRTFPVNRLLKAGAITLALLSLSGCQRPTPIKEIAENSAKHMDQEVRVQGKVTSSFALPGMTQSYYVVSDGTGQMGISTTTGAPATNSEVTVVGQLQKVPAIALPMTRQFKIAQVMIKEKERRVQEQK